MSVDEAGPEAFDALWSRFVDTLRDAPSVIFKDDVPGGTQMRAEGYRYLTRLLRGGIGLCMEYGDADYPAFGKLNAPTLQFGIDCPNYLYDHAMLRPGENYRMWGRRGGLRYIDIDVVDGDFSQGTTFVPIGRLTSQDLEFDGDAFEVFIGPDPQSRNWIPTADRVNHVLVRRVLGDWDADPGEVGIERVGAVHPGRAFDAAGMAGRFERLVEWMSTGLAEWDRWARMTSLSTPPNTMRFPPADSGAPLRPSGGFRGQWYGNGNWDLGPDEALILEFEPQADAVTWGVGVVSWFWEQLDYSRSTSLNDTQAAVDADGRVRMVVAHTDPGVANWLDTTRHRRGVLWHRSVWSAAPPVTECRVVDAAELFRHLPADTARVSPAERSEILRRRDHAVWRRGG